MSTENTSSKPSLLAYVNYLLVALFLCYEMALQASPSVMTNELMRDLHIDASGLGIMAASYFYAYTIMQIPAGLLFDRFSLRGLVTVTLLICVLGAFFFQLPAEGAYFAAFGRFLMGVGSAFAFIGVLVVAGHWFPARYFAFLVGFAQMLGSFGAISGEVPLAALVERFDWRPTMLGITVIGVVLAILIWAVVRNYPKGGDENPHAKTGMKGVSDSLRSILKAKQTWWVALYAFTNWAPVTIFAVLWGVPYMVRRYAIDNTQSAMVIASMWVGVALTGPFIGWLSDRIGQRCLPLTLAAAIGLVTSVYLFYGGDISLSWMYVLAFIMGGAASAQILAFAIMREIHHKEVMGTAIGFTNMAVVASGALFQPLVGYLLDWQWDGKLVDDVPFYSLANYHGALWVIPVCFLVGGIVSQFFIRETNCRQQTEGDF